MAMAGSGSGDCKASNPPFRDAYATLGEHWPPVERGLMIHRHEEKSLLARVCDCELQRKKRKAVTVSVYGAHERIFSRSPSRERARDKR